MSIHAASSRLTLRQIQALHAGGEKIAMLTAYDFVTAALVDQSGVELILVGDSLGNVVLGFETTIPVRLEDTIRHTAAVVRGTERALVIADLPFGSATDPETALRSAIRVFQETGCQAVKLEGGLEVAPVVDRLVSQGIPVMAHIGLVPQSIHQLGGYYKHGKTLENAVYLRESALALQSAGAFAVVLEMVVPELATEITSSLKIPTIGIGSGEGCSGQVLVINDLIGLGVRPAPKFAKPRADVAGEIRRAVSEYVRDVKGTSVAAPGLKVSANEEERNQQGALP